MDSPTPLSDTSSVLETSTTTEGTIETEPIPLPVSEGLPPSSEPEGISEPKSLSPPLDVSLIILANNAPTELIAQPNSPNPNIVFKIRDRETALNHMKSSPTAIQLADIESAFHRIMSDGVVNAKDIPDILVVVQKTIEVMLTFPSTQNERLDIVGDVLKYVVAKMVMAHKVKKGQEIPFAQASFALIDNCIGLIKVAQTAKPRGKWWCF